MRRTKILIAAAIALVSTGAIAGLYQPAPVTIDLDNQFASGDISSASNSKDDISFIGCGTRNPGFRFGFCQAGDEFGNQITCFTTDPSLLDDMRALSDTSYIQFNWVMGGSPVGGACTLTAVGTSTQSFYIEKAK